MSSLFKGATSLWALAAIGLAGLIVHLAGSEPPKRSKIVSASTVIGPLQVKAVTDAVARLPSDDLVERIAARPLFSESRRPAPPKVREDVVIHAEKPTLELIGTIIVGDEPVALLKHQTEGLLRRRIGQSIGDWKLIDVEGRRVSLENEDGLEVLVLRDEPIKTKQPPKARKSKKTASPPKTREADRAPEKDIAEPPPRKRI